MTVELPPAPPPQHLPPLEDDHVAWLPAGWLLVRLHETAGRFPTAAGGLRWFGPHPDKGRFDHRPPGPPRTHDHAGIAYFATDDPHRQTDAAEPTGGASVPGNAIEAAVAEAAQQSQTVVVTESQALSVLELVEPLTLLDVRGRFAQQTRTGTHLSAAPHPRTQQWARAIHQAYPHLSGIAYAPATGGRAIAVAVTERARPPLAAARLRFCRHVTDPSCWPLIAVAADAVHVDLAVA